jgi:hypothetical protein
MGKIFGLRASGFGLPSVIIFHTFEEKRLLMIPWFQLFTTGASLAEIAKDVYLSQKSKKNKGITGTSQEDLVARIKLLEENEVKQAALISGMADQMQRLGNRTALYFWTGIFAIIIAVISIALHILA